MQVRKLDRNTFDVYGGQGFENWSRIRRFHWGVKVIDGIKLDRATLSEVEEDILMFPDGHIADSREMINLN